jgi:mannose-6-phosphate isomerase-like protein (cupin superfamily)
MTAVAEDAYARLLLSISGLYRADAESGAPMLAAAADRLRGLLAGDPTIGGGQRKPVCRFMPDVLRRAAASPLEGIAEAFAAVEPLSDWVQNPNYTAETMGRPFVDSYGYVELVGPGRPYPCREMLVGLLLLGPKTHYPDHAHAAEEVYHVVAGTAEWWREDGDWVRLPPGSAIHHPPRVRHATRTRDEPLLALYCWRGAIREPARLTEHRS